VPEQPTSEQDPDWELKLRDGRRVLRLSVRKVQGRMGQVKRHETWGFRQQNLEEFIIALRGKPTGAGCFGTLISWNFDGGIST